ncbi:MAG: energy-coupling factor transporter ATPase [Clostridia bacterium]|nr:energy-coupling factor transporter ATPase [Clostridia bacterium]
MLRCENVTFVYENDEGEAKKVLDRINLNIEKGSFVALLGRNGSGKSTLAKHFNAVLTPTEGRVIVNGIDTSDAKRLFDIRKTVGMVFQNPDNQIVATTVEEDIAFGLENLGVPHSQMLRRIEKALKSVDMYDFRYAQPHLLSGGQKQRVAIAGVIAMEPECIVLDEPTAMLDPKGRREVMASIKKLNKEAGITVVLITHYMEEAAKADRVVVMDKGSIVLDGSPKKVFSRVDEMTRLGLDVPQVTLLVNELRKKGIDIKGEMLRTEECAEALDLLLRHVGVDPLALRENKVD